jgi:hypothetical protein
VCCRSSSSGAPAPSCTGPSPIVYIGGFLGALVLWVFIVPVLYEAMASVFDRPGRPFGTADAGEAPAGLT